jgi:Galactose oxidase, central domain/Kelch motif
MTRMNVQNVQKVARILTNTLSGLLALGLAAATAAPALGQAHGTWALTGPMHTARFLHTATLLQNGQVLVAGGLCSYQCGDLITLAKAELYNPSTGTWTETGSMSTPRSSHVATLLKNGEVLVTGGNNNGGIVLHSAELYNPSTGTWSTVGNMTVARYEHGAALLQDGEVLVAGGTDSNNQALASAELYDPSTRTFTETGSMHDARADAQVTLLPNGEALIAEGCTAELFSKGQWHLAANLVQCTNNGTFAALLPNGDVLVDSGGSSEFYDLSTNVWQATKGRQSLNIPSTTR